MIPIHWGSDFKKKHNALVAENCWGDKCDIQHSQVKMTHNLRKDVSVWFLETNK